MLFSSFLSIVVKSYDRIVIPRNGVLYMYITQLMFVVTPQFYRSTASTPTLIPTPTTAVLRSTLSRPAAAAECARRGTGTAIVRVEVEKRVTVAVVCGPVERERYVAVETEYANDVLTLATFVFVFVFVAEDRAVLVRVPAKLVEWDVCTVPVAACAVAVACVAAADSAARCVVPSLSKLSVCRCQTPLCRAGGQGALTYARRARSYACARAP